MPSITGPERRPARGITRRPPGTTSHGETTGDGSPPRALLDAVEARGWTLREHDAPGRARWTVTTHDDTTYDVRVLPAPADTPGRDALVDHLHRLATVDHEHLVGVAEVLAADSGTVAVLTSHVPGLTLAEVVAARDALTAGEAVTLLVPVAQALAALHHAGVVHGRLTAHDVTVPDDGRPLLHPSFTPGARSPADDVHDLARLVADALPPPSTGLRPASSAPGAEPEPDADLAAVHGELTVALRDDPRARPEAGTFAARCFDAAPATPLVLPDAARLVSSALARHSTGGRAGAAGRAGRGSGPGGVGLVAEDGTAGRSRDRSGEDAGPGRGRAPGRRERREEDRQGARGATSGRSAGDRGARVGARSAPSGRRARHPSPRARAERVPRGSGWPGRAVPGGVLRPVLGVVGVLAGCAALVAAMLLVSPDPGQSGMAGQTGTAGQAGASAVRGTAPGAGAGEDPTGERDDPLAAAAELTLRRAAMLTGGAWPEGAPDATGAAGTAGDGAASAGGDDVVARVAVPGSPAHAADTELLAQLAAAGVEVIGARTDVHATRLAPGTGDTGARDHEAQGEEERYDEERDPGGRVAVEVEYTVGAHVQRTADGTEVAVPAGEPVTVVLVLVWTEHGWRAVEVLEAG